VGKPKGKKSLGIPRHGWENTLEVVLIDIILDYVGEIHLAEDRDQWWNHEHDSKALSSVLCWLFLSS
jgi:hypothetical protein